MLPRLGIVRGPMEKRRKTAAGWTTGLIVLLIAGGAWIEPVGAQEAPAGQANEAVAAPGASAVPAAAEWVTLEYKDADLFTVLRSMASSYNLNLLVARDIKGRVSANLNHVTVDEALSAVLALNGYSFVRKGNMIYITQGQAIEGLGVATVILPLKYTSAATASTLLQKVISPQGDIRTNEATNSLVITDFPSNIDKIAKVLGEIDLPPTQVLIEAKLIDITESEYENLGLTYAFDYQPVTEGRGLFGRRSNFPERLAGSGAMAGPSSNVSGGQFAVSALSLKGMTGTLSLDALLQNQKARLLASPSILALNGKEARIIIGERYPYKEKTQTTTGTTETTKFVDIGTTLRVTPQVSPDGWITMNVHPEVSSLTSSLDAGPRISTREADATVRVRDGETIIIGGLIKRQDDRTRGGIPILRALPLIGGLFSKSSSDNVSTELVVFITPHIIKNRSPLETKEPGREVSEEVVRYGGLGGKVYADQLWKDANDLIANTGLISRGKNKYARVRGAADAYELIGTEITHDLRADRALYLAIQWQYHYLRDPVAAKKNAFFMLKQYPSSRYVGSVAALVRHFERIEKAQSKRQAASKPSEKKKTESPEKAKKN